VQRHFGLIVRFLIIAVVVLTFIGFMVSYTVGFNEKAVVSTFGRADESSVIDQPGLRFRIPYVHSVTKYDSRLRLVETTPETQSTSDQRPVVLTAYLTWRVEDPLRFYQRFSGSGDGPMDHYAEAERILTTKLRSAMTEVGQYRLDQLLSADPTGSSLPKLEERILDMLKRPGGGAEAGAALADSGIVPVAVGISTIALPQEVTKSVIDRMNKNREKIIGETISRGASQASAIRSSAENDAKRILAFAKRSADGLRNQGYAEVTEYTKRMDTKPELAVFLKNMELMRMAHGRSTTLVLPTSLPGLEYLTPGASNYFRDGTIPIPKLDNLIAPPEPAPAPANRPAAAATGSKEGAQ
jgi:membrane protease subunit HflC